MSVPAPVATLVATERVAAENQASHRATGSISPPLYPWAVVLLVVVTFGTYASFWLARTARESRSLGLAGRSPALWFLAGLTSLPLLFVFPRLRHDWAQPGVRATAFGHAPVPFALLAIAVLPALELPGRVWTLDWPVQWCLLLACLALYAVPFAFAQRHINRFKNALPEDHLSRRPYRLSMVHICVLVIGSLFMLSVSAVVVYEGWKRSLGFALEPGQRHESADRSFSLEAAGSGWRAVPAGTNSPGESELELAGPVSGSFVLVYRYTDGQSIAGLGADRIDMMVEDGYRCAERRSFDETSLRVRTDIDCEGRALGRPVASYVTIIEVASGLVEVWSHVSASDAEFGQIARQVRETARSLQVLPQAPANTGPSS